MYRNQTGFSLLELVIVMTIAGALLAVAMPRVDVPNRRLDAAVREAWSTLSAARQQAVMKQHDVLIEFLPDRNEIRVGRDEDNSGRIEDDEIVNTLDLPEGIVFARANAPVAPIGEKDISFSPEAGESAPRMTFHRSGAASEWGGFYLSTTRAVTRDYANEVRAIEVQRATGRVGGYHLAHDASWERSF